jgi:hypothetical protein
MNLADLIGGALGFVFTILVFSYLLGDNALFRVTIHIFIGVAAAFVGVIAFYNVILYRGILPLFQGPLAARALALLPPLVAGGWLLATKGFFPRLTRLGNPVMAFLVGAGAATAIGGSILGTLFPQITGSINLFNLEEAVDPNMSFLAFLARGILVLVGVLSTLIFFHFGTRTTGDQAPHRPAWIEATAQVGQIFIAITFGALFAGVYASALTAFIERMQFLVIFLRRFLFSS